MDRTRPTPACSYADLRRVHEADLTVEGRSAQQIKNQLSSLNAFMRFLGRADSSSIIEDFDGDFDSRLHCYAQDAIVQGLTKVTVENRLSHLRAINATAKKVVAESAVQESFTEAVQTLLKSHNMSISELSRRIGHKEDMVGRWISGKTTPAVGSRKTIEKIEDVFSLPRSSLVVLASGYEPACQGHVDTPVAQKRLKYRKLSREQYAYRNPCPAMDLEWRELLHFYTAPFLIGMKRNSTWRVKSADSVDYSYTRYYGSQANDGICITAGIVWATLSRFFGYLLQNGFSETQLSLALMTDSQLVASFLEFKRKRAEVYTKEHKMFLGLCTATMRPETGYLWQKPEFGSKLRTPVTVGDWQAWCDKNRTVCLDIVRELKRGNHFKKGRNPFDPIVSIISMQHPIQALFDMVNGMQRRIPFLTNPPRNAVRTRDLVLVKMLITNPLRIHNFAMMTWREDNSGNIYKDDTGAWRLRFDSADFKNHYGAADAPYDVVLSVWIYPELEDYLYNHRALLCGAEVTDHCCPAKQPSVTS